MTTDPSAAFDLRQMAARPFEDAVAMPPSVYTSEEFLARERSQVFRKDWIDRGFSFVSYSYDIGLLGGALNDGISALRDHD